MSDESQAEYEQYRFELRATYPFRAVNEQKATVTYIRQCKHCKGVGHHAKDEPCICVQNFKCPCCGFQHGKMVIAWAIPSRLQYCDKCHWANRIGETINEN